MKTQMASNQHINTTIREQINTSISGSIRGREGCRPPHNLGPKILQFLYRFSGGGNPKLPPKFPMHAAPPQFGKFWIRHWKRPAHFTDITYFLDY